MNFRILILLLHLVSGFYDTQANSTELQSGGPCELPPYPDNGFYLINGVSRSSGTLVNEYSVLSYHCNPGFTAYSDMVEQKNTFCLSGSWASEIQCLKVCRNLVSYTLHLTCIYKGEIVGCYVPMHNGTRVTMRCKPYHSKVRGQPMTILRCSNGKWIGNLPYCTPVCGEEKPKDQQFILGGELNDRKVSPWQVGVYRFIKNKHEYQCGGTIVSNKVVITAAHCFDTETRTSNNYDEYRIVAGKVFSDWEHKEIYNFEYIQKNEIETLKIPPTYYSSNRLLENNIAVVIVKETFVFSANVHPACVELYDEEFNKDIIVHGNQGKVFRWDTTEKENQSSVGVQLKEVYLPVVDKESCFDGIFFRSVARYDIMTTYDMFCAEFKINGSTFCNEDTGNGFLMDIKERDLTRWYLMGVLSDVPIKDIKTGCSKTSFIPFTRLDAHSYFIKNITSQYK